MEEIGPFIALAAWLVILLFLKTGLVGMAVVLESFFPQHTERVYNAYRDEPSRCIIWGIVNLAAGLVVSAILVQAPILRLFGLALFFFLIAMVIAGYTAVYRSVGQRLRATENEDTHTGTVLRGGIASEAAFLAPVLGQLFSVTVTLRGFGAVVLALLLRKGTPPTAD